MEAGGAVTDFRIVLRSLAMRRFSTTVTVAMVAVSVALLLVLLSMRDAGRAAFRRGTGNAHLLVSADSSPLVAVLNGMFYANAPAQPIDWAAYLKIREAFPWSWTVPTQLGDSYRGSPVVATSKEFFTSFEPVLGQPWAFVAGRPFDGPYEAVVGSEAARAHGIRVGTELILAHGVSTATGETAHEHDDHPVEVVGILAPTGSAHDRAVFTSLETGWCVHAEESRLKEVAAAHPGEDDHDHVHVNPEDLRDSEKLITGILLRVPTRPGEQVSSALPVAFDLLRRQFPFTVAQPAQQVGRLFEIVSGVDTLFIAMAVAVMVAGALSIMLALYNSMDLRRRQVAILRVLGASAGRVFGLVLAESALIGLLGSTLGVALSLAVGAVASAELQRRVGLVIEPTMDLRTIVMACSSATFLACAAGIVPAMRAYRTPVVRGLRPLG